MDDHPFAPDRTEKPDLKVWPEPLNFLADQDKGAPELLPEHVPTALWPFINDTAVRMGVDPTSVALGCLVACASVINDDWKIQPKRFDDTWTESARLWAAIIGDPGVLKTPVIAACTRPISKMDGEARERHQTGMRDYKQRLALWKRDKPDEPEPVPPKLARYLVEGATVEALSEVLRDDDEARQYAPARKVLSRHDEMSEFFANLDRYKAGGKGGGDRGAYLRMYNGDRYTIDRIGRGSFTVPNWSACFLGGVQPGPIQRIAKDAAEDGLLPRFMFSVPGPQKPGVDRKPDDKAIRRYGEIIPALGALSPCVAASADDRSGHVVFHENAHQHRDDIDRLARAMAHLPDTSPRLKAAFDKWSALFARLCLTMHLIDVADGTLHGTRPYEQIVTATTAERVSTFMQDILLPHLLRAEAVMFATVQTSHARWIAGYILANQLSRITARDIVRAYGQLRAPEAKDELAAVMSSLTTINWLEPELPKNPVKPVSVWEVNPAVHVLYAAKAEHERNRREQIRADIAADVELLRSKRRRTDSNRPA